MFFSAYMFAARIMMMIVIVIASMIVIVIASMVVVIASADASKDASNVFAKTASALPARAFVESSGNIASLMCGNFSGRIGEP